MIGDQSVVKALTEDGRGGVPLNAVPHFLRNSVGMCGTVHSDTMNKAINRSCQIYEQADKNIIISFLIFMIFL